MGEIRDRIGAITPARACRRVRAQAGRPCVAPIPRTPPHCSQRLRSTSRIADTERRQLTLPVPRSCKFHGPGTAGRSRANHST